MTITVASLADHPELLATVAGWMWREWGSEPEERVRERLARRANRDEIPFTLVGFADGEPVGALTVCWDDVDAAHADRGPWLSGVVVHRQARNLGVGRALLASAEQRTAALGHGELWLHTGEAQRFYERCGYELVRAKATVADDAVLKRALPAT